MLVIPPGLSEEEEALQKKFNKLKKKVRGRQACWLARLFQTLRAPGMRVRCGGSPASYPKRTSQWSFGSLVQSCLKPALFSGHPRWSGHLPCGFSVTQEPRRVPFGFPVPSTAL